MTASPPSIDDTSHSRRERLLREASRIFAAKGFDKASTREICQAAGANIGLISYHFGDKLGLYRAVLVEPVAALMARMPMAEPQLPLRDWLRRFYGAFLQPLRDADPALAELMRLCGREMIEPSKVFEEVCAQHIGPQHHALVAMLAERCGASEVDAELHHLGFALVAMAHDYWMSAEFMDAVVPGLMSGPVAYERLLDRLVAFGEALIVQECEERKKKA